MPAKQAKQPNIHPKTKKPTQTNILDFIRKLNILNTSFGAPNYTYSVITHGKKDKTCNISYSHHIHALWSSSKTEY